MKKRIVQNITWFVDLEPFSTNFSCFFFCCILLFMIILILIFFSSLFSHFYAYNKISLWNITHWVYGYIRHYMSENYLGLFFQQRSYRQTDWQRLTDRRINDKVNIPRRMRESWRAGGPVRVDGHPTLPECSQHDSCRYHYIESAINIDVLFHQWL